VADGYHRRQLVEEEPQVPAAPAGLDQTGQLLLGKRPTH
jgi:hypothetical protein